MRRELEHFRIGDSYGGNQDWFPTFMMRIGGCGAETACDSIWLRLQYSNMVFFGTLFFPDFRVKNRA